MKRLVSGGWRYLRKFIAPAALLVLGLIVGFWTGRVTTPVNTQQSVLQSSTIDTEEESRLDSAYTSNKERLADDLKSDRVTAEQAATIQTKMDELYTFRKNLQDKPTSDAGTLRDQKRQELHEWIKTNGVSVRYFIRLY